MAQRQYAAGTTVGVGRSKEEIAAELRRMKAVRHAMMDDDEARRSVIVFEREGVRYRITLPLPDPRGDTYWRTPSRRDLRSRDDAYKLWMQDVAERWRALAVYIKTLRVSAEAGIVKVEEALLPFAVLSNGETVAEYTLPQIRDAYSQPGYLPPMIPGAQRTLPAPQVEEERGNE